ncbi:MAG: 50S ribosomal protein L29 [Oscillospiraceae bacterium]|nr:50S ribosomal protein L29 [Oscillospiraceae bacterium]
MKVKEIREKTTDELNTELREAKNQLFNLRFQHAINQLDNPIKIAETRKTIARILTVLREKEIQSAKSDNKAE